MRLSDPDLARFFEGGVLVLVATRDAAMTPFVTRAWGIRVLDDARVAVQVGRATSGRTLQDLEDNGCIAVSFGDPVTSRGLQLKGYCDAIDEATEADVERARRHLVAFVANGERLGFPPHLARSLYATDLVTVSFSVREMFDQTPGRGAGRKL